MTLQSESFKPISRNKWVNKMETPGKKKFKKGKKIASENKTGSDYTQRVEYLYLCVNMKHQKNSFLIKLLSKLDSVRSFI